MSITTNIRDGEHLRFKVGTSGFMTSQKKWLACKSLNCIELNSSFYRIPTDRVIGNLRKLPKHVKVIVKVSKFITHSKRLKDVQEPWQRFWNQIRKLEDKLECLLFQLPPTFLKNDTSVERIIEMKSYLPNVNTAFEFRNSSWLNSGTYGLFSELRWCIVGTYIDKHSDTKWVGDMPPGLYIPPKTCNYNYIRIHGKKGWKGELSHETLQTIKKDIVKQRVRHSYVMFNNTFFNSRKSKKTVNNIDIEYAAVYDATMFAGHTLQMN